MSADVMVNSTMSLVNVISLSINRKDYTVKKSESVNNEKAALK